MNTRFVGTEAYIPSLDVSRPAFGVVNQEKEVQVVFAEGTPDRAQEWVLNEVTDAFSTQFPGLAEVADLVSNLLVDLVRSGQIRRNQFNGQWFWLG